jgi:hypothetical protein
MEITDGSGKGYSAHVSGDHQLHCKASLHPTMQHESETYGNAFVWKSVLYDSGAGDTILLVRNTSLKSALHIDRIVVANTTEVSQYTVHLVNYFSSIAGTQIDGITLNTSRSHVADAVAYCNETSNTQGTVIGKTYVAAGTRHIFDTRGVFLGTNQSIAVDVDVDKTANAVSVSIYGHYMQYPYVL